MAVQRSLALTWHGSEHVECRLDTTMLRPHAPADTDMIQMLNPLLAGGRGLLQVAPGIYLGNKQDGVSWLSIFGMSLGEKPSKTCCVSLLAGEQIQEREKMRECSKYCLSSTEEIARLLLLMPSGGCEC